MKNMQKAFYSTIAGKVNILRDLERETRSNFSRKVQSLDYIKAMNEKTSEIEDGETVSKCLAL